MSADPTWSKWNVDSLHDLMDERDRRYEQRFAAQEKAIGTAQTVIDSRLIAMNEWRQTVTDILSRSMPRPEVEQRVEAVSEKIEALASRIDKTEGRGMGQSALWGWIVGGISTGILVINFFTKH